MKEFFTIREFARLRNINVNSMRYYEKLGLLKPAYTDENTGYRYYKADQLAVLDKIILCINLGIPLKEMVTYIDESGTLHSQKLLEHGRKVAKNKMNQLQNTLNFIDFSLKSIEENKEYKNREDWYIRKLDQRRVIITDFFNAPKTINEFVSEVSKIYKIAQEMELFPILPAGQFFKIDDEGEMHYCLFLQIMDQEKELPNIMMLSEGNYSCLQVNLDVPVIELDKRIDVHGIVKKHLKSGDADIMIIDNIILDKYNYEGRPSEIQKLLKN